MKSTSNIYWKLFKSTFLISAFSFGGGFVIIPMLQSTFVEKYKWLDNEETLDLVAIAQSSPGAIAVNASIILGYKIRGLKGAFTTVLATILPPLILLNIIALFYDAFITNPYIAFFIKGVQAGATAIILDITIKIFLEMLKGRDFISVGLAILCFILAYFFKVNIIYIVIACAIFGMAFFRRA